MSIPLALPRQSPSGPLDAVATNTDEVSNVSSVTGGSSSDALDTLFSRTLRYLDLQDDPVALWNFNRTIGAVRGPAFGVFAGSIGFSEISPGVNSLVVPVGARLSMNPAPSLVIPGDLSIEAIIQYQDNPSGNVILSHGAGNPDADPANNTLYQLEFPTSGPVRTYRFFWESGNGVDNTFTTPSSALSPSLPTVHTVMSIGWRRQSNVLTPFLNGRPFSASSGTVTAPTGGTNGFLTLGAQPGGTNTTIFQIMSLAIYNRARSNAEWQASYNRSMGERFGIIS